MRFTDDVIHIKCHCFGVGVGVAATASVSSIAASAALATLPTIAGVSAGVSLGTIGAGIGLLSSVVSLGKTLFGATANAGQQTIPGGGGTTISKAEKDAEREHNRRRSGTFGVGSTISAGFLSTDSLNLGKTKLGSGAPA